MPGSFVSWFVLLAQAPAAAAKADESAWIQFLPLAAVPLVFYFLMLRPEQQKEKKRRQLLDNVKKSDKVLTVAGIYGTVISVDEKNGKVQLRLDDDGKVKATFTKASIVRILDDTPLE